MSAARPRLSPPARQAAGRTPGPGFSPARFPRGFLPDAESSAVYLGALAKLFSGSLGEHLQGSAFLVEDYFAKEKKKNQKSVSRDAICLREPGCVGVGLNGCLITRCFERGAGIINDLWGFS